MFSRDSETRTLSRVFLFMRLARFWIFFLVLITGVFTGCKLSAQNALGKHPADKVLSAFWSQNGNANTTVSGLNANASTPLGLAIGGLGYGLSDPGADRILFWDASAGHMEWLTIGSGLSISGTTLVNTGGSGSGGGITTLNSLTDLTQTFAIGASGTDVNISSASGVHTFNFPTASAAARGVLSPADWSTFNGKQASGNYITALTGDVAASGPGSAAATLANSGVTAGTYTKITVDAKGRATVGATAAASDLSNGTTGSGSVVLATSPTITTPTISSFANANHNHQNAAGGGTLNAAAIASGTVATARLGSGVADNTKFLRGDSTWSSQIDSLDVTTQVTDGDNNDPLIDFANDAIQVSQLYISGIRLGTGASAGYVLTSDGSGNGSWQIAPGAGGGIDTMNGNGTNTTLWSAGDYKVVWGQYFPRIHDTITSTDFGVTNAIAFWQVNNPTNCVYFGVDRNGAYGIGFLDILSGTNLDMFIRASGGDIDTAGAVTAEGGFSSVTGGVSVGGTINTVGASGENSLQGGVKFSNYGGLGGHETRTTAGEVQISSDGTGHVTLSEDAGGGNLTVSGGVSAGGQLKTSSVLNFSDLDFRGVNGGATTTDSTPSAILTIAVPSGYALTIEAFVTAFNQDGSESAGYKRVATFRNPSGTTSQVGTTADLYTVEDNIAWDCTIDASSNNAQVTVTGVDATSINWMVSYHYNLVPQSLP